MKVIAWPAFKTKYKNPYNWLLYSQMLKQGVMVEEFFPFKLLRQKYDIFHLHWPVETIVRDPNPVLAFVRATAMLILIDLVRARGTRIVWTIHDQYPHLILHPKLAAWFQSAFVQRVDGYISLCKIGNTIAEKHFPLLKNCPSFIVPHGHYREFYPNQVSQCLAKSKLTIPYSCKTLVFFGYIDVYKNVPHLIRIFRELSPNDWVLVIAGKPESPEIQSQVLEEAKNDSKVKLFLEFVTDDEVQIYLKAANLVILPFQEILNSGSALLALSFDCPILVPHKGAMAELQEHAGEDWVKLYPGDLTTAILQEGMDWAINTPRLEPVPLEELEWSRLSEKTMEIYRSISTSSTKLF